MQDVFGHLFLALFPLATKMLVTFPEKWIGILFFGINNLATWLILNWMTIDLTVNNVREQFYGRQSKFITSTKKGFISFQ